MSASFFEIPHSHPAVHLNYPIINRRVEALCGLTGVDRSHELFGFESSTVLRLFGREGSRARPLYLGDAVHFFSDIASASIPMVQIQHQEAPDSEIEVVTYAVPAEGPMVVYRGETLELDSWSDFVEGAIQDPELYAYYANMLPNILYEMSNGSVVGTLALQSAGATTVNDVTTPLF